MKHKKFGIITLVAIAFAGACGTANEQESGKQGGDETAALFASKCSMCHDFKEDKIGPALAGVQQRWGNDTGKLKSFIRNSQQYIASGDPYAIALYKKWNESAMPSFTGLSEEEMNQLIEYLK